MGNNWNKQLPRIKDGVTTFSESDINPIISDIEQNLSYLKSTLEGLTGQCGYIATLSGFSSSCKKGMMVALDDGLYVPAAAEWTTDQDNGGNLIPSSKANVVGVLLEDVSIGGSAAVLCAGWTTDPELIRTLTGSKGTGEYYLTADGRADLKPLAMGAVVRCFTCVEGGFGSGNSCVIFNPQAPEYNGHTHNTYKVTGKWVTGLIGADLPDDILDAYSVSGEASKLDISASEELKGLVGLNSKQLVLFKNGTLVSPNTWCIDGDYMYTAISVLDSDELYIGTIYPLVGTTPILRSIEASGDLLKVYNRGGNISLAFNGEPITDNDVTGYAVSSISSDGVSIAPVVNRIYPGVGISIGSRRDEYNNIIPGSYEIHARDVLERQLDIAVTNLNGVLLGTDSDMVSYIFPPIESSMCGNVRIPKFNATSVNCRINILIRGNNGSINAFSAKIMSNSTPEIGGSAPVAAATTLTIDGISQTSTNSVYRLSAELPRGMIKSDDHVSIMLSSTQDNSVSVLAVSLELFTS